MRPLLTLLCLLVIATASMLVPACAAEEDPYPIVIGDTTDGPDQVVIPPGYGKLECPACATTGTSQKDTIKELLIAHCQDLQYDHYHRPGCYQTYHNDVWLGDALQWCNTWANTMTPSCQDEANSWMYWSTHQTTTMMPYYGDQFRWSCSNSGGWPVLLTPNDTGALRDAYYACDPLYATAPLPWE